jgi:hypothetical protein
VSGRYHVVPWHGEGRSLFYVVDGHAPEDEQPAILGTFTRREWAESTAVDLNACEPAPTTRAGDGPVLTLAFLTVALVPVAIAGTTSRIAAVLFVAIASAAMGAALVLLHREFRP